MKKGKLMLNMKLSPLGLPLARWSLSSSYCFSEAPLCLVGPKEKDVACPHCRCPRCPLSFPVLHSSIVSLWRSHARSHKEALTEADVAIHEGHADLRDYTTQKQYYSLFRLKSKLTSFFSCVHTHVWPASSCHVLRPLWQYTVKLPFSVGFQ